MALAGSKCLCPLFLGIQWGGVGLPPLTLSLNSDIKGDFCGIGWTQCPKECLVSNVFIFLWLNHSNFMWQHLVALFQIGTIPVRFCSRATLYSTLERSLQELVQCGPQSNSFSSETCSKLTACSIGFTSCPVQPLVTVVWLLILLWMHSWLGMGEIISAWAKHKLTGK